ncbi:hotdog fold thioesterase [Saprospiraceae bacterium]|jgi:acyl-CoA thioesterase|nr:hotdog fold thioesterase [Bacteroidota bacterium]MDB4727811.1 hotdog fold thioesterase [Saprospiraceae bacterium]MDF1868391.1 hotdog fold thioesterase [Saprospiraceae bacterium]
MTSKELAKKVVDQMFRKDYYSQWLGIERLEEDAGKSILRLTIRKEMLNGFGIAHGGITYSLADSALAFACNSHGRKTVSVETSISHTVALKEGDVLTAFAEEESKSNKIGVYRVIVKRETEVVAVFKGVVYRTSKEWEI